ncbi:MucBP domain-containing protein [Enterococcus faecalis]|uniref:MucBP domain-containing protein n=1 Tax=Enterococcus faecalis TaxID=1351 RepID=UPI001F619B40|nr:MucBP domain-containing protein [Enterococcus faecalis]
MTTKNLNEHTIEVSLPDNVKFSWGIFYINATAKSLTAAYTLKVTYKSDVYTEGISAEINNLRFQNTGNKGFIPNLTTQNKSIKTTDSIANVNDWLLKGVTASDEEDGDLSEEVTVSDDGGITEAIANGSTGTYTVTYTVTDSDANTVTKTSKITIYSDITVHYVDDSGNKLQEDKIISGNPGDTIFIPKNDIILENIDYYVASSNPVNITGNFGDTNQIKDVTLFYKENKQSISGSDFSMYVGDKTPTVSDFKATATDKDGKELEVTADFSKVDFSKAGTYEVTLQTTDGQTKTVKLVIKENKLDSFSKTLRKKALSRISPS